VNDILSPALSESDLAFESALRPTTLAEFVGNWDFF